MSILKWFTRPNGCVVLRYNEPVEVKRGFYAGNVVIPKRKAEYFGEGGVYRLAWECDLKGGDVVRISEWEFE